MKKLFNNHFIKVYFVISTALLVVWSIVSLHSYYIRGFSNDIQIAETIFLGIPLSLMYGLYTIICYIGIIHYVYRTKIPLIKIFIFSLILSNIVLLYTYDFVQENYETMYIYVYIALILTFPIFFFVYGLLSKIRKS